MIGVDRGPVERIHELGAGVANRTQRYFNGRGGRRPPIRDPDVDVVGLSSLRRLVGHHAIVGLTDDDVRTVPEHADRWNCATVGGAVPDVHISIALDERQTELDEPGRDVADDVLHLGIGRLELGPPLDRVAVGL